MNENGIFIERPIHGRFFWIDRPNDGCIRSLDNPTIESQFIRSIAEVPVDHCTGHNIDGYVINTVLPSCVFHPYGYPLNCMVTTNPGNLPTFDIYGNVVTPGFDVHKFGEVLGSTLWNAYERVVSKTYFMFKDEGADVAKDLFAVSVLRTALNFGSEPHGQQPLDDYGVFLNSLIANTSSIQCSNP